MRAHLIETDNPNPIDWRHIKKRTMQRENVRENPHTDVKTEKGKSPSKETNAAWERYVKTEGGEFPTKLKYCTKMESIASQLKSINCFTFLWKYQYEEFMNHEIMHIKKIFGLEIRVPPPGKIRNFGFLPKTYFSPGISKCEFPPPGRT